MGSRKNQEISLQYCQLVLILIVPNDNNYMTFQNYSNWLYINLKCFFSMFLKWETPLILLKSSRELLLIWILLAENVFQTEAHWNLKDFLPEWSVLTFGKFKKLFLLLFRFMTVVVISVLRLNNWQRSSGSRRLTYS